MGSIPLAANNLRVPEQPNALEQYARLVQLQQQQKLMPGQLQQQQQQIQAGQQENQVRGQQIKDQQAMTAAYQKWDGKDPNDLAKLVSDAGGSATARTSIEQHYLGLKKQYSDIAKNDAETGAKNLDILKQKNDNTLGAITAAESVPDDQLGAHLAQTVQQLTQQQMLDPQHAQMGQALVQGLQSGQVQPKDARQALDVFKKSLQSYSQMLASSKSEADAAKANADAAHANEETNLIKKFGGTSVEAQQQADWLAKNPGKGPSDFAIAMKKVTPQFQFNLQNSGTTGNAADVARRFGYSPVAFDQAAEKYWQTGQLPPAGRGGPALATNKAIQNRAAELHPEGSLAGNSAAFKANQDSLKSLQKNFDQVTAFENTAGKNLDVFLGQAQKVIDSGNPMINRPLRTIIGGMGGADQAAFDAARTTALTEISKVLNSSNASGVLSDSARHEVEGLIKPNATLQQIVSAANILKQDMGNRHQAYQDQIADLQKRLSGGQPSPQAQPEAPKGMIQARDPQGKLHQAPAGTALPAGWKLEQ